MEPGSGVNGGAELRAGVRYRDSSRGYRILVQCYQDGYVELRPAGRGVTPRGGELLVPLRVRREMVEVGQTIRSALRRGT